jgi:hypothetical protein
MATEVFNAILGNLASRQIGRFHNPARNEASYSRPPVAKSGKSDVGDLFASISKRKDATAQITLRIPIDDMEHHWRRRWIFGFYTQKAFVIECRAMDRLPKSIRAPSDDISAEGCPCLDKVVKLEHLHFPLA